MSFANSVLTPKGLEIVQGLINGTGDIVCDTVEALTVECDEVFLYKDALIQNTVSISSGAGSPEGVIPAGQGSLYLRTDGSTNTTLYVKTSQGTAPLYTDGWTAK